MLIKETIADLDHQLKEVGEKLEALFGRAVERSSSKGHPLTRKSPHLYRLLHGLLLTEPNPEGGNKSQLLADGLSLAPEKFVDNAGEEGPITAIAPSQKQVLKLVDQLMIEPREELGQREVADLLVLRDEWEAIRHTGYRRLKKLEFQTLSPWTRPSQIVVGYVQIAFPTCYHNWLTSFVGRLDLQTHECGDQVLADRIDPVPEPCFFLEELSEELKKERASLLLELKSEPPSSRLQASLETFRTGSLTWDVDTDLDTFIKGLECSADLCGPRRDSYYNTSLKGLHSISSFKELWNQAHPQHPITPWDPNLQLQCPPSWSSRFEKKTNRG